MQPFLLEKQAEIRELCRKHHVKQLFVFGSAARDDFDPARSDLDLLVEFEPGYLPRSSWLKLDLEADLEKIFLREVDLAVAGSIRNPYVLQTVQEDQQLLYAA